MRCYIGIGSNLGSRLENIRQAIAFLKMERGIKIEKCSPLYETRPCAGPPGQRDYLNLALEVSTRLAPHELLRCLKKIEKAAGRKPRKKRWAPREIDLDILLCGRRVISSKNLIIPHPRMHERRFVLKPLFDIAPRLSHPLLKKDIATLLASLKDKTRCRKIKASFHANHKKNSSVTQSA